MRQLRAPLLLGAAALLLCAGCSGAQRSARAGEGATTKEEPVAKKEQPATPGPGERGGIPVDPAQPGGRGEQPGRGEAPPASPLAVSGCYQLKLEGDASWHRHSLRLTHDDPGGPRGMVVIDRGIGPQGRAPMPDETAHLVAFQPRPHKDPNVLIFTVTVGKLAPLTHAFHLSGCPAAGGPRCREKAGEGPTWLKGTVAVTGKSTSASMAVTGLPCGPSQPKWPAWGDAPRGDKE